MKIQIIIGDKEVESWNKRPFDERKQEKFNANISFRVYEEEVTHSTSLDKFITILNNFSKD